MIVTLDPMSRLHAQIDYELRVHENVEREYEAEAVHRIQIYFADSHGCWRWTDSRHKRPMSSIVLNPGVKEMLLSDTKDFLKSEKVRGIVPAWVWVLTCVA